MKRIFSYVCTACVALFLNNSLAGQINPIYGPYDIYEGPYYIRVFVNYVESNPPWTTNVDLTARTVEILANLNSAFNQHNIYFIGSSDPCALSDTVFTGSPSNLHPDALDIFDFGNSGTAQGYEFSIPSAFCQVEGAYGTLAASHSPVLIHEVGHCLGLAHIHNIIIGCTETGGDCPGTTNLDCNCCGDFVCDTPPITSAGITVSTDCLQSTSPTGLTPEIFRNYMSYAEPGLCRDRFTAGQAERLWEYLALDSVLWGLQLQEVVYPGATPSGVCGNIVVESGHLVIDSPLEMLPGGTIRVKKGARLTVASTITGACGKMWQGIIVEGTISDLNQLPVYQGRVDVVNGGKIEHARCGIDVQDVHSPGVSSGTGGGIVRLWLDAQIKDNIIGIRFGAYGAPNHSSFNAPIFSVTDEYRGGDQAPTLLQLNSVNGLQIRHGRFLDLRAQCPSANSRAIGIDARDAGFRVSISSSFEDLYLGIRADKLAEINGSLFVSGSNFLRCYKGIELKSSGSFAVTGNDFLVEEPDACALLSNGVTGAEISGKTTGFDFSRNNFYSEGEGTPDETLIGTACTALGQGLANIIFKNDYNTLSIGNRASGNNGYGGDGLLYLCNTNSNFGIDFLVDTPGNIRYIQGEILPNQPTRPAGNLFTGDPTASPYYCTIVNHGLDIDYYFYNGDPLQDPGIPDTTINDCDIVTGFKREPVSQPNGNCVDPDSTCFPCPEPHLAEWKTRFLENRQQWQTQKAAFPFISGEQQRVATADTILRLRLAMNRDGSRILMQYSLDTLGIDVDSITRWLALLETYSADLRLARHHFFTGDYTAFDSLWSMIPSRYDLDEDEEDEFTRLGEVYDTLHVHLSAGTRLENLPQPTRETLKAWALNCDESGFLSQVILWRNGVEQSADCSGGGSRPVTTISELPNNFQLQYLKIYPNPASQTLNVEYPGLVGEGTLRLCNLQGQTVIDIRLPGRSSRVSVPVSHLAPGIYFAELHSGQGLPVRRKIVISR